MKTISNPVAMQRQAQRWQRAGVSVALAPTMGALHAGHASLIRRARKAAGEAGLDLESAGNPAEFIAKGLQAVANITGVARGRMVNGVIRSGSIILQAQVGAAHGYVDPDSRCCRRCPP